MKSILLISILIVLIGCDRQVTPESITEIVYREYSGFAGITWEFSINKDRELYQQVGRDKRCEGQLTDLEWKGLVEGFDWQEFKTMKSEEIPVCYDISSLTLKVKTRGRSHEVTWVNIPPEGSVRNLQIKLYQRMSEYHKTCK